MSTPSLPGKPAIALTMGDPCGIGPEVIAKAVATGEVHQICQPIVIGSAWVMEQAIRLVNAPLFIIGVDSIAGAGQNPNAIEVLDLGNLKPDDVTVGQISPAAGQASVEWVTRATELALEGQVQAIATAPINKEAVSRAGLKDVGHTELLQRLAGVPRVATMLLSGPLRVVHLTTHRALLQACTYVKKGYILETLELIQREFQRWGVPEPRIGVAALNPHAGDGGLVGTEEQEEIAPAIEEARSQGINASGPIPADIVFHLALKGQYDVVLAMYHDQGHIPVKVYGFERSVSVNLGLPFIRTSVDHGTAFDIAGQGIASHESMLEGIRLAARLMTRQGLALGV
ncbi:MAG: 4-hydroxythreonine-4-phosphate dehydrogenase PdxA [Dehalococcoidia bacterium]